MAEYSPEVTIPSEEPRQPNKQPKKRKTGGMVQKAKRVTEQHDRPQGPADRKHRTGEEWKSTRHQRPAFS
jgi:hypothetical protein